MAAESWSTEDLLAAGWSEADLGWESAMERTVEGVGREDYLGAQADAGYALEIARAGLETIDPRLGTSLANHALCLRLADPGYVAAPQLGEALDVWRRADRWIARMEAPRTARSSLFHMRMEVRNREIYRERWRTRWREIAGDARARLELLLAAEGVLDADPADALSRWRRERPAILDDTRKLMAAAFLLLAPPAPGADAHDQAERR